MTVVMIQWSNTYFKVLKLDLEHRVIMPSPDPTNKSPVISSFIAFTPWRKNENEWMTQSKGIYSQI